MSLNNTTFYMTPGPFGFNQHSFDHVFVGIEGVLTGMGIVFNGAFLISIIWYTPEVLRAYAVLLFNFALVDFSASVSSMMSMQRLIFSGWAITYVYHGGCVWLHPYACYLFHCFNCHVFAHSQWILLVSFVYRFWVLVKAPPSRKNMIRLCWLVYIPSVLVLGPYAYNVTPPDKLLKIMQDAHPDYNFEGAVISGNASLFEWTAIVTVVYMCIPCPFIYGFILYFRSKTLHILHESNCNLSVETKKNHRNLVKALTIQACIPCFYFMGAFQYMLGQFHIISGPIPEYCTFMAMEMMPTLTPLISLYFITPYRRAVLSWFGRKHVKVRPPQSTTLNIEADQANGRSDFNLIEA